MSDLDQVEIILCDSTSAEGHPLYPGFKQETKTLPRGFIAKEGALSLPCDILWERDLAVTLRDGTVIYTDIYRPAHAKDPIPAIISAGPFGKNGGFNRKMFQEMPWRCGVPQCTVSGLEKFEALDPAYWCLHGYALIHPDVRGSWRSGGNTYVNSKLDGEDGYDLVEWVASLPWCNKKVSYAGNSWLSQTQWFVGAERPPHLACLAPWEGWNDLYNDDAMRGGVPNPAFQQFLLSTSSPALGKTENIEAMAEKYPCWNQYWEDRKAKLSNIDVPMYITASWTNGLHTRGTFQGWLESSSTEKWLRVHNSHEWPDLYYPQNVEDLRKFFDQYLKGIDNDWKFTPKVRLCILNPGHSDIINRPEYEFPLKREVSKQLFLNCETLGLEADHAPVGEGRREFDGATGQVEFTHVFSQRTELIGYSSLKVWIEAIDTDDIDLYVKVSKLSADGALLESKCIDVGYLQDDPDAEHRKLEEMHRAGDAGVNVFFNDGPNGILRASHRELDLSKSTPSRPVYGHKSEEKLRAGQVVPVVVELWPYGMVWEAGEKLRLSVSGRRTWPQLLPFVPTINYNKGRAVVHAGDSEQMMAADFSAKYTQANLAEGASVYDQAKFQDWSRRVHNAAPAGPAFLSLGVLTAILVGLRRGDAAGTLFRDETASQTEQQVKDAFVMVREAISLSAPFVGLPNVMPACFGSIAVLKDRGIADVPSKTRPSFSDTDYATIGAATSKAIYRGVGNAEVGQMIAQYLPDLSTYATVAIFGYLCGGGSMTTDSFTLREMELVVAAAIIGMGATRQARSHCKAALQLRNSAAMMTTVAVVAGEMAVWNGTPLPERMVDVERLVGELKRDLAR